VTRLVFDVAKVQGATRLRGLEG